MFIFGKAPETEDGRKVIVIDNQTDGTALERITDMLSDKGKNKCKGIDIIHTALPSVASDQMENYFRYLEYASEDCGKTLGKTFLRIFFPEELRYIVHSYTDCLGTEMPKKAPADKIIEAALWIIRESLDMARHFCIEDIPDECAFNIMQGPRKPWNKTANKDNHLTFNEFTTELLKVKDSAGTIVFIPYKVEENKIHIRVDIAENIPKLSTRLSFRLDPPPYLIREETNDGTDEEIKAGGIRANNEITFSINWADEEYAALVLDFRGCAYSAYEMTRYPATLKTRLNDKQKARFAIIISKAKRRRMYPGQRYDSDAFVAYKPANSVQASLINLCFAHDGVHFIWENYKWDHVVTDPEDIEWLRKLVEQHHPLHRKPDMESLTIPHVKNMPGMMRAAISAGVFGLFYISALIAEKYLTFEGMNFVMTGAFLLVVIAIIMICVPYEPNNKFNSIIQRLTGRKGTLHVNYEKIYHKGLWFIWHLAGSDGQPLTRKTTMLLIETKFPLPEIAAETKFAQLAKELDNMQSAVKEYQEAASVEYSADETLTHVQVRISMPLRKADKRLTEKAASGLTDIADKYAITGNVRYACLTNDEYTYYVQYTGAVVTASKGWSNYTKEPAGILFKEIGKNYGFKCVFISAYDFAEALKTTD